MGKYEVDRDHEKVHPEEEREGTHLTLELAEGLVCEDVLCGVGMGKVYEWKAPAV